MTIFMILAGCANQPQKQSLSNAEGISKAIISAMEYGDDSTLKKFDAQLSKDMKCQIALKKASSYPDDSEDNLKTASYSYIDDGYGSILGVIYPNPAYGFSMAMKYSDNIVTSCTITVISKGDIDAIED